MGKKYVWFPLWLHAPEIKNLLFSPQQTNGQNRSSWSLKYFFLLQGIKEINGLQNLLNRFSLKIQLFSVFFFDTDQRTEETVWDLMYEISCNSL